MEDLRIKNLKEYIRTLYKVAVAYSGGVDSTLLLRLSVDALSPEAVKAVTIVSPLLPPWDMEFARNYAPSLRVEHILINGREKLYHQEFSRNDQYRCYYCKKFSYEIIKKTFPNTPVLSGTNASDMDDFRPGIRAENEEGIKTPFLDLGITKEDIREISQLLEIPGANRPASACLASRIWTGEEITEKKLNMVKEAELFLKKMGIVGIFRVRLLRGNTARIETEPHQLERIIQLRETITRKFKSIGFRKIELDMEGYAPAGKIFKEAQQ